MAIAKNSVPAPAAGSSRWEERSARRVLDTGRDQILERSRRLVQAAYELLDEEGLDGLTIRAVLKKTGLARRAFYERFEGKDDLVLAVFEQTIRSATDRFAEHVRKLPKPMERLKIIVTYITLGSTALVGTSREPRSNRRSAALSREHLRLAESHPEDLQAALRPLLALISQEISEGMKAGVVRKGDPDRMAALVYNLVSTTVQSEVVPQETARPDRVRREKLAAEIWEFCERAIAA